MIDKCIEPEGDQARIRPGICAELDQLRCQYEQLDEEMQEQVQRHLAPFLLELSRSGDADMDCLMGAKFKMTMIPSMGFFIVMPKSGVQQLDGDNFEERMERLAESIGWEFSFQQTIQRETMLYF